MRMLRNSHSAHFQKKSHSLYILRPWAKKNFFVTFLLEKLVYFDDYGPICTVCWPHTSHKATHILTHIICNCFRSIPIENLLTIHYFRKNPLAEPQVFPHIAFCWAQMTLWCQSWGSKPPQIASHIHIIYIQSVLAPLYAVEGHMGAPLLCYACAGREWILWKLG